MYYPPLPSSIKESQLDAFCPLTNVYCYPRFELRYLKNLKLFSIRVKELSEPVIFVKKCHWL